MNCHAHGAAVSAGAHSPFCANHANGDITGRRRYGRDDIRCRLSGQGGHGVLLHMISVRPAYEKQPSRLLIFVK